MGALRRVARIGLAESRRTGGSFDRRTTALLTALGLAMALMTPAIVDRGLDFDRGLYRAAVDPGSPLRPAILESHLFQSLTVADPRAALRAGDVDVAVVGTTIVHRGDDKGRAATAALADAAESFTHRRLLLEPDQAAAFPVRVTVTYLQQEERRPRGVAFPGAANLPESERPTTTEGGDVVGGDAGAGGGDVPVGEAPEGGFAFLPPESSVGTPGTLAPPFPFRSLVLAYVFLVPLNFVVQVYAGTMIAERIGRKGEALLASPARPWEIVLGKTAPYVLLMLALSAAIAVRIGGGWLSVLAIVPLVLAFLSLEFAAAMFARSFRELTFLTVFTSVGLTIYAFLPAVFSDVHPIALVSPITLVVLDLRDVPVSLGQIAYATLPLTVVSLVLFRLGFALYREEDLFHQKPVLAKTVDAVARQVRRVASAVKIQFLLLPFVVVLELLLVTFLFAWPFGVGVLGVLLSIALVEETFKALPSYAAATRGLVTGRRVLAFGALTGLGFFLAEKLFLAVSLMGLAEVDAGTLVFGAAGSGVVGGASPLVLAGLLLAPLALHVATATMSAWGAANGRRTFRWAFLAAVLLHTTYNWAVLEITTRTGRIAL